MRFNTKRITLCGLMAALSVVFMFIGTVFPSGRMGFMAIASLFTVAVVIQYGYLPALAVYVVSTVLGFLILPDKAPIAFYAVFFGYYPVIKSIAEKLKKPAFGWGLKFIVFNAALTLMFVFLRQLLMLRFFDKLQGNILGIVIYIAFNIIFAVYDVGISKLIGFYMVRIYNKLR